MAFPFKTGGDFYNCEAQRMRLHNLGANPTETATGLMYFNTGASNLGKHAVVHDGTNFKALAFVDEIATNTAFTELAERVDDLETALGTDEKDVLDTWEEVKTFLASIKESDGDLMTMLNGKLDKSGGTITSGVVSPLALKSSRPSYPASYITIYDISDNVLGYMGYSSSSGMFMQHSGGNIISVTSTGATFNGNTLIHSGNIGEYNAGSADVIAKTYANENINYANNESKIRLINGTASNSTELGFPDRYTSGISVMTDYTGWQIVTYGSIGNPNPFFRLFGDDGRRSEWRQLAFLDDNVASAQALKHSNGTVGAVVNESGNVTIGDVDTAATISGCKLFVGGDTYVGGKFTLRGKSGVSSDYIITNQEANGLHLYVAGNTGTFFAANGNVLIGTTEDNGAKLQVSGNYRSISAYKQTEQIEHSVLIYPENPFGLITRISTKGYVSLQPQRENGSETFNLALNPLGGNVLIGTKDELKSGAKLQVKGDLYVDGNIIATKEVSAGGAGQEGESGDGGAEVISQQLAKGQSTYTITNTIKRSDIAVSLYEETVINSQTIWSLCLADIEVTNETITVTFGSATSVNHKLVAVG